MSFVLDSKLFAEWELEKVLSEGLDYSSYLLKHRDRGSVKSVLDVMEVPFPSDLINYDNADWLYSQEITDLNQSCYDAIDMNMRFLLSSSHNTNLVKIEDYKMVLSDSGTHWILYVRKEFLESISQSSKLNSCNLDYILSLGIDVCDAFNQVKKNNLRNLLITPKSIYQTKSGLFKLSINLYPYFLQSLNSNLIDNGDINYKAPEIVDGMSYNSSTNIYSLGIVMLELLRNYESRLSHNESSEVNSQIQMLSKIIEKASAVDPQSRYQNPHEFRNDLLSIKRLENLNSNNTNNDSIQQLTDKSISGLSSKGVGNQYNEINNKPKEMSKWFALSAIGLLILVIVIGASLGLNYLIEKPTMPNLIYTQLDDINQFTSKLKLNVKVYYQFNTDFEEGTILAQSIAEGTEIGGNAQLFLEVSTRAQLTNVPKYNGMKLEEFEKMLVDRHLVLTVIENQSDVIEEGFIIKIEPDAGTQVKEGTEVKIYVSTGKWSPWIAKLPDNVTDKNHIIETKIQYRSSEKLFSKEYYTPKNGWILYNTINEFSNWSEWSETLINGTPELEVETQIQENKIFNTYYHYSQWIYTNSTNGNCYSSPFEYKGSDYKEGSGGWNYRKEDYPLDPIDILDGEQRYGSKSGCTTIWWNQTLKEEYVRTEYITNYRSRTIKKIYSYYQWSSFSNWSFTVIKPSTNLRVESRVVYRYKPR